MGDDAGMGISSDDASWPGGPGEGGHLEGWAAWSEHVRALLDMAATRSAPLLMLDEDFVHWPLGERACVAALDRWALASRHAHCTMMARDWSKMAGCHPRWVQWRTPWGHRVLCRQVPEDELSSMQPFRPMLVAQGVLGLQMLDQERGIAVWSRRPPVLAEWWHQGDAILQRSQEAMPATTLGL